MKTTRAQALKQVLRFEHYGNFPDGKTRKADQEELIRAFMRCENADHAAAAADWLITKRPMPDCRFCPVPAEIYVAADETRPAPSVTEWAAGRETGDEPFNGFADLIDDNLHALLARKRAEREQRRKDALTIPRASDIIGATGRAKL